MGAAEAADRDRLGAVGKADFEIVAVLAPVRADRPRGADRAGTDGVDGDPVGRKIKGERLGEPDDRPLGGSIGGAMLASAERPLPGDAPTPAPPPPPPS